MNLGIGYLNWGKVLRARGVGKGKSATISFEKKIPN